MDGHTIKDLAVSSAEVSSIPGNEELTSQPNGGKKDRAVLFRQPRNFLDKPCRRLCCTNLHLRYEPV